MCSKNGNKIIILVLSLMFFIFTSSAQAQDYQKQINPANKQCLSCHGQPDLRVTRDGINISLYVNPAVFTLSMHGAFSCTTCHQEITEVPHKNPVYNRELVAVVNKQCENCHRDVARKYRNSIHGLLQKEGHEPAMCSDCHGYSHNVLKKEHPASAIFKKNIPGTCTNCHDNHVAEAYRESFHGKAVHLGGRKAADCADCHGAHEIQAVSNQASTVSTENVTKTCNKCHYNSPSNLGKGTEHWIFKRDTPGEPMYWTLKFFTWLTIIVISLLIIHIELELYRRLKERNKH